MIEHDVVPWRDATFRKSSYSGGQNGSCVELAYNGALLGVRDSKNAAGPVLKFSAEAGHRFLGTIKQDRANRP